MRKTTRRLAALTISICITIGAFTPTSVLAIPGDHNKLPEACQGVNGAAVATNEALGLVIPPPLDLVPSLGAYSANWLLRLCKPQIAAPGDLTGSDSFRTVDRTATSDDPEMNDPYVNDANCYASISQVRTEAGYDNFYGIEFFDGDWGDLGTPDVFHFNTGVDVRLYAGPQEDDPATPKNEALNDSWPTSGADDSSSIKIPVGKNRLTYRADTLVSILDVVFIYLPTQPTTSKSYKELVKQSGKLRAQIASGYRAVKPGIDFIRGEAEDFALDQAIGLNFRHSQIGIIDDVFNQDFQEVWVLDEIPPAISTRTDISTLPASTQAVLSYDAARDVFFMEAIHPGGIRANSALNFVRPLLDYSDHCGRRVSLSSNGGGASLWPTRSRIDLVWTVSDPGPRNANGDVNTATLTQAIEVRDSFPPVLLAPPSQVHEVPANNPSQAVSVNLGVPQVFDLADLSPELSNDATGNEFSLGLTEVTWTANDGSNTSTAVQLINIKIEGTNTPPVADAQQLQTESFKETEIILTGSDADFHSSVNRYDPLTFKIVDPPANGDLVAPLLPYFIEDVRLEASALRFSGDLRQSDPLAYCAIDESAIESYQLAYPLRPEWMAVDDAGDSIVYDFGSLICGTSNDVQFNPRLVVFDENQELSFSLDLPEGGGPTDIFWDHHSTRIYMTRLSNDAGQTVDIFRPDLSPLWRYDLLSGPPGVDLRDPIGVAVDSRGIMYVANNDRIQAYAPINAVPTNPDMFVTVGADSYLLGTAWVTPGASNWSGIESLTTDSENNLYVGYPDRVVKITAAAIDASPVAGPNGLPGFVPGETVGWLGVCTGNLTGEYACDTPNRKSLGFSCTDLLCARDVATGSEPGQLNNAKGIAIDPNDVLYVSDSGNSRVQRFTADGFFGGEARSTGIGYGFLLGDFGVPTDIEVNSEHFYILNRDSSLLHIFKTTPITPIDDGSARVVYRSDNNFTGTDQFRFGVTDGFDSAGADVVIDVTRSFRPPDVPTEGLAFIAPQAVEDTPLTFSVPASDPDGVLDPLSIIIVVPPQHGSVVVNGLDVRYTPDPDYAGLDGFSYQVSDGSQTSESTGTVSINVSPVSDAPRLDVPPDSTASLGFRIQHQLDVYDPDPGAGLTFSVDWGDGTMTTEGHFELNGVPIPASEAYGPNGQPRSGVTVTGPLLSTDSVGRGRSVLSHSYASVGLYEVMTCVVDEVQTDPQSQEKTATGASQSACGVTAVQVDPTANLLIDVESPSADVPAGSDVSFTVNLRNLPFDLDPDDARASQLPGSGTDIVNLKITSEISPGLAIRSISSNDGTCVPDGTSFQCNFSLIPYNGIATFTLETRVSPRTAGRAQLSVVLEGEGVGMQESHIGAGFLTVQSTGRPPFVRSIWPTQAGSDENAVVTIKGRGFEAGARVYFGALQGSEVDVIDRNTATVRAPSAPIGVVDLTVVNPDHQESKLTDGWTYVDAVDPSTPAPRRGGGSVGAMELILLLLLVVSWRLRRRQTAVDFPGFSR